MTMDVDAAGEQHAGCEGPAQPVPGTAAAAHSTSVLCLCMGTHAALRCVLYVCSAAQGHLLRDGVLDPNEEDDDVSDAADTGHARMLRSVGVARDAASAI